MPARPACDWSVVRICSQLGGSFGVRTYLGGELNSPVVEWLNKGLMFVHRPYLRRARGELRRGARGTAACRPPDGRPIDRSDGRRGARGTAANRPDGRVDRSGR
eukprot:1046484-Prorocentrum_minimum.AAC.1